MKAKEKHKLKLLEYLGNPQNDFLNRQTLAKAVLGLSSESNMYRHFTPDELSEIECEALAIRRKKYAPQLSRIDKAMIEAAVKDKNPKAGQLCYQRFEDWGEKKLLEHSGKVGIKVEIVNYGDLKDETKV